MHLNSNIEIHKFSTNSGEIKSILYLNSNIEIHKFYKDKRDVIKYVI